MMFTMSGSIGSGSVQVIPSEVEDEEMLAVEEGVEACPVVEANAKPPGPVSSTRSRANASLRTVFLDMVESPFPAQMCAGAETRDCERRI